MQLSSTRSSAIRRPRRRKTLARTIDPYLEGKLYYYSNETGGFGAFWEEDDGDIVDLEINPTGITAFNERTDTIQSDKTSSWTPFTIDLSSVTNIGRLYFYCRKTSGGQSYKVDVALDDLKLYAGDETEVDFDPSVASVRSNDLWQCSDSMYSFNDYAGAKSNVPANSAFVDLIEDNIAAKWQFANDTTGSRSSGTGPDNAADNNDSTFFVYFESSTTSGDNDKGGYLRWNSQYNLTTGATV